MRVAAVVLMLTMALRLPAPADVGTAQDTTKAQTFVVQSMVDEKRAEIGSGVVVSRDGDVLTLATAAHLVNQGADSLRILDLSRHSFYQVVDIRTIAGYDLALIRIRAQSGFRIEPAGLATPVPGEAVWVWGNPGTSFWTLSPGTIQTVDASLPGQTTHRITMICNTCGVGDSGSGVFSTDGKLIGILAAGWRAKNGPVMFIEVQPVTPIARELFAESARAQARQTIADPDHPRQ